MTTRRGAGLHERCIADAFLCHPERVCMACYDRAESVTGESSAFALARWIAAQGVDA